MNFSSIQAYLQPSNWEQPNLQLIGNNGANPLLEQAPPSGFPPTPGPPPPHSSIRPGSMSERARMANLQMPEIALKCPRCDSTNTKFCYFNNYSLTQPRHFCKNCRRYWTKGGALRSVPVGGGCRRNKRSKSRNSKSPLRNVDKLQATSTSASGGVSATMRPQQLRILSPPLLGNNDMVYSYSTAVSTPTLGTSEMNVFQSNLFGTDPPWTRLQQFPSFDGSDHPLVMNYPFQFSSSMITTQIQQGSSVKTEENHELMNRSAQNGMGAWTEDQLHNFTSSSTINISPRID